MSEFKKDKDFFDKFDLEVKSAEVEVGEEYPIYGMITRFISDDPENVIVEINYHIRANLSVNEESKIQILKSRVFEPGIFMSTVKSKTPVVEVDCKTVVFGKKQEFNA